MTLEEKKNNMFSSEQLETVHNMIGEDEPSLFSVLQHLSKQYDEKTTIFLAKEFCLSCETFENQRVSLEFLYMNGFQEELASMIQRNLNSSNHVNKEWGEVYNFILERRNNMRLYGEPLIFTENLNTDDPTLQCLLKFLRVYAYNEKFEYILMQKELEELTKNLLDVNNTLMIVYFQARENEVLFHYHWRKNELNVARNYAENIIQNTYYQVKRCEILLNVALTYMLEDYHKSVDLLEQAKKIAKDYNFFYYANAIEKKTKPFVLNVNGIIDQPPIDDEVEYAHYLINVGKKEEALDILNKFEELTVFQEYYKGLALESEEILQNVYNKFVIEKNDYFLAQLPLRHLPNKGGGDDEKKGTITY